MQWEPYDPNWLVELAREQYQDVDWLKKALSACTKCVRESREYIYFVDPEDPDQPDSQYRFECNILLEHPKEGTIVLDVLEGQRIGRIEFLNRL